MASRTLVSRLLSRTTSTASSRLTAKTAASLPSRRLPVLQSRIAAAGLPRTFTPISSQIRSFASETSNPSSSSYPQLTSSSSSPASTSSDPETQSQTKTIDVSSTATTNADGSTSYSASFTLPEELKREYELTFTCKVCTTRSTHKISHQGYHKGTVLISCPGCKNRHLIADHLKIFTDKSTTIEDIMREKGEIIKKGIRTHDGDIEILPTEEIEGESGGEK